jgi:flavin reductase (DIM6/NTAB) family NADH-FMN oxidoreductase RutF
MSKIQLPEWYDRPVFLVGVYVDGKPNVMTAAGTGFANGQPPMVSVPFRRGRYTLKGILENKTFSLNIPSVELIKEVDFFRFNR